MLNQYDKARARLVFALAHGSSRKARDTTLVIFLESVVSGAMSSALLHKLLADLRAARHGAVSACERTAIDGAIADIVDGILAAGDEVRSPPQAAEIAKREPASDRADTSKPQHQSTDRPLSKHSPFYGLGLREACPKLLSLSQTKTPLTPREIWEQLQADGYTSAHNKPVHAVNDALRRRAKTHRDVFLVGAGRWGKTEWYTEAEIEEIKKSVGGMGGRDRADHIERTKAGMATAKLRGAKPGKRLAMTAEQWLTITRMLAAGESVATACETVGMFPSNYYYHKNRGTFDGWKEGDPWPPQNVAAAPTLQLVKK